MQKKIIALAVAGLMSGAAFAQSNVTISGLLDVGVNSAKREGISRSNNAGYNNTATSNFAFRAVEDLGGGMKAGVFVETNPVGAAGAVATNGTLGDFQRFVYINGGFGELSLGKRTNFSTTTAVTAQPFGTAMGGGYAGGFARLRGDGFNANGDIAGSTSGTRDVRADGSVRYDSPDMAGFKAGLSWKPKNNGATGVVETASSSGHMNLGLNYAAGPLNVSYAYAVISNNDFGAADTAFDSKSKHNLLAANYTMGAFTLYGGYTTSKGDTAAAAGNEADSRSWNIAAKFAASSSIDIMANYLKDNDKLAANADRKLVGLGMDYKLSKRTAAYLRYENYDPSSAAGNDKVTTYSAGLRHSF